MWQADSIASEQHAGGCLCLPASAPCLCQPLSKLLTHRSCCGEAGDVSARQIFAWVSGREILCMRLLSSPAESLCLCCPTMAGWAAMVWLCLLQLCGCTRSASPCEHKAVQTPRAFLCVWLPLSKHCDFLGSDLWQRVCSKDSWVLIKREHEDNTFQLSVRHPAAWWDNRYWCVEYRRMFSLKLRY